MKSCAAIAAALDAYLRATAERRGGQPSDVHDRLEKGRATRGAARMTFEIEINGRLRTDLDRARRRPAATGSIVDGASACGRRASASAASDCRCCSTARTVRAATSRSHPASDRGELLVRLDGQTVVGRRQRPADPACGCGRRIATPRRADSRGADARPRRPAAGCDAATRSPRASRSSSSKR